LYEATDIGGNAVWSWPKAKDAFLEALYPGSTKQLAALESLQRRHRAWYASEFKEESKVWYKPGRGGLDTIDAMLAEYDRAHTDYVAVWYNLGSPVKETRRALKDLGFALRRLNAAVEYWLKYDWEKSHDKRSSAVEKLEKQMKKDKKAIDAVETWLDRITEGYPAQWF
ncbi:MAG: hypothetical protein ACYSTZ_11965, partial [Planctomycetota bacterium]|jgi:predicted RNase H-like nuclease (RuvC/YqgF family)